MVIFFDGNATRNDAFSIGPVSSGAGKISSRPPHNHTAGSKCTAVERPVITPVNPLSGVAVLCKRIIPKQP